MPVAIPLGLRTALESGQCVLFVGSGVGSCSKDSAGRQSPDGAALARALAEHFSLEGVEDATLAQIAKLVEIRRGRPELEAFIAERLRALEPDGNLLWLFSLRWKAIFTTNYDALIQETYGRIESPRQTPVTISATSDLTGPIQGVEVPIYHLHGSLFHGEKGAILITEDDYARFRETRRMLFALLKAEFATSTILYLGYSHRDPNWRTVLEELREEFAPSTPPPAFRVALSTSAYEAEILRARGVETVDASIEDFVIAARASLDEARLDTSHLEGLRARVPGDLANQFDQTPAPVLRLLDAWEYVNQAPFDQAPNVQSFLKGEMANWAVVSRSLHFERDVESPLYDALLDVVTGPPRVGTVLLLAPAGYGTSTILMSLAARLVADGAGAVFKHRAGRPLLEGDVLFATSLRAGTTILFVDNAADHKGELFQVIHRLREAKRSAILVVGERLNEWTQRPPKITGKEFRIEPLSDAEIARLLQMLEDQRALGTLEHLTPALRVSAVKQKHEKQLLVALREVTEGKSFDAIIEDEYRGIDVPLAQRLYQAVCGAYQIRSYVRDAVLGEVLGVPLPELYTQTRDATEGIVEFDYEDSRGGGYGARARHHVIAQVVWERCVSQAERSELIEHMLSALNLGYHLDVQLLDGFIRTDLIVDSVRGLDGKIRFFETAAKKRPDDPYVLQHYARMLLRQDRPELALAQIERAIAVDDQIRVLHHTKGKVLAQLAEATPSEEIARKRLAQAEGAFRRVMSMHDKDPYSYQSLAELYLAWAKRVRDEGERIDYLTRAEEVIGQGLPKVWDREGLWIVSSAIQRWLGNRPEAISALERGITETPGSIVARYILGVRYLEHGEARKALGVLRPLVSGNPNDFRPCIAYAVAQVEAGEGYAAAIATMQLGELFGLRDAKFLGTLGGLQFMNESFTEARATFKRSAEREFTFEELTTIRFTPPREPGSRERLRLKGEIAAVRKGYAFVRTPGYDNVFCRGSKFGDTLMRDGLKVSYDLGFSARGPVALNVWPSDPADEAPGPGAV